MPCKQEPHRTKHFLTVLHPSEKTDPAETLSRTRAAIGTLGVIETELRLIRKGMAPTPEKIRLEHMIRLGREAVSALERKLPLLERELLLKTQGTPSSAPPNPEEN